jgi:hypothetical protein
MVGTSKAEFRAVKGNLEMVESGEKSGQKGVRMSSAMALALGAKVGDSVRYAALRAKKTE